MQWLSTPKHTWGSTTIVAIANWSHTDPPAIETEESCISSTEINFTLADLRQVLRVFDETLPETAIGDYCSSERRDVFELIGDVTFVQLLPQVGF